MPDVSIVVPSYNHEKFITAAIESVIRQTYTDYELIISDDASTDHSVDVIEAFIAEHPELPIRLIKNQTNLGGVLNLNQLISQASSKYIAVLNSDDIWVPEKLETQVEYLERHPEVGAVFTHAVIVDEQGVELPKQNYPFSDVFFQQNRSRGDWLRRFFFEQNCLCHPSVLIRRNIYSRVGCYDPRYRQIPDFEMWLRLVKHTDIHIIEHPMTSLLWHGNNTSAINPENILRGYRELHYILRDFFEDVADDIFIDGFQKYFRKPAASSPGELACEKAFIYFHAIGPIQSIFHNIGLDKIFDLLCEPLTTKTFSEEYQFSFQDLIELNGREPFGNVFYPGIQLSRGGAEPVNETLEQPCCEDEVRSATSRGNLSWKERIKFELRKTPFLFSIASTIWRQISGRLR